MHTRGFGEEDIVLLYFDVNMISYSAEKVLNLYSIVTIQFSSICSLNQCVLCSSPIRPPKL